MNKIKSQIYINPDIKDLIPKFLSINQCPEMKAILDKMKDIIYNSEIIYDALFGNT